MVMLGWRGPVGWTSLCAGVESFLPVTSHRPFGLCFSLSTVSTRRWRLEELARRAARPCGVDFKEWIVGDQILLRHPSTSLAKPKCRRSELAGGVGDANLLCFVVRGKAEGLLVPGTEGCGSK